MNVPRDTARRRVLLIHGGIAEDVGADQFWVSPGIVAALKALDWMVVAPDRNIDAIIVEQRRWGDIAVRRGSVHGRRWIQRCLGGVANGNRSTQAGRKTGAAVAGDCGR